MKIIEKLKAKQESLYGVKPVTIAFLGDSVTQGCFECYEETETKIETEFDYPHAYSTRVRELLNVLYPKVQVNVINSGISGDNAPNGLTRVERDILPYSPDLVVVSYGLNDSGRGLDNLPAYRKALAGIFKKLQDAGCEVIFLTQNMMATHVSCHLTGDLLRRVAASCAETQNNGTLDRYFEAAREEAGKAGIPVCELYKKWQKLAAGGVDVTELLANKINHPIREIHEYMATELVETMFEA